MTGHHHNSQASIAVVLAYVVTENDDGTGGIDDESEFGSEL